MTLSLSLSLSSKCRSGGKLCRVKAEQGFPLAKTLRRCLSPVAVSQFALKAVHYT